MRPTALALALLACALLGALLTGAVRRYALRRLLDVPNQRSSHATPTPRGGGLAIVVTVLLGSAVAWLADAVPDRLMIALVPAAAAIAAVGWWDDHVALRARVRLLVQLVAAGWVVAWLGGMPELDVGAARIALGPLGAALAVLGIVWLTNLYNFMDGIDGIAGGTAVVTAAALAVVMARAGYAPGALLSALLAGSAAGFLVWNWPPARIFMGDVGSGFIGFVFAALLLAAERDAGIPALALLLPLAPFVVDATYTLVRRIARGERFFEAHRSHVYQRLVAGGWSHRRVTLLFVALSAILGAAAVWVQARPAALPAALAAAVIVPVGAAAFAFRVQHTARSR